MQIRATIADIETQLLELGTAERAAGEKSYLKSDLEFLGATVPQVRMLARRWLRAHPDLHHDQLLRVIRALWRRRVHESRTFGVEVLVDRVEQLTPGDLGHVEWILRRANTWAHVDPVSVQVAGRLVNIDSGLEKDLDRWSRDENFWLRRAALLAHLLDLRHGQGDWQRFNRYASQMLEEREFFIRKAIGWVLREAGKATPSRVVDFLATNMNRISGLSLREAVKHLDRDDRDRLLAAYRDRG